jgi:hypothetical protein
MAFGDVDSMFVRTDCDIPTEIVRRSQNLGDDHTQVFVDLRVNNLNKLGDLKYLFRENFGGLFRFVSGTESLTIRTSIRMRLNRLVCPSSDSSTQ